MPPRGSDGRFVGARVNLESVPRLPAWVIRQALEENCRLLLGWFWPHYRELRESAYIQIEQHEFDPTLLRVAIETGDGVVTRYNPKLWIDLLMRKAA